MCSCLAQFAFCLAMVVCLGLTIGGAFSPTWTKYSGGGINSTEHGLFPYTCMEPEFLLANFSKAKNNGTIKAPPRRTSRPVKPAVKVARKVCEEWWQNLRFDEYVVLYCLGGAVLFEVIAILLNFFAMCSCCCKKCLVSLLIPLALLAFSCLLVVAVIYVLMMDKSKEDFEKQYNNILTKDLETKLSYSVLMIKTSGALALSCAVIAIASAIFESCCL